MKSVELTNNYSPCVFVLWFYLFKNRKSASVLRKPISSGDWWNERTRRTRWLADPQAKSSPARRLYSMLPGLVVSLDFPGFILEAKKGNFFSSNTILNEGFLGMAWNSILAHNGPQKKPRYITAETRVSLLIREFICAYQVRTNFTGRVNLILRSRFLL